MSDLIDRQKAIDALMERLKRVPTNAIVTKDVIESLPGELQTVQPEPKEGHWIWVAGDLECSKCHTRYPDLYPDYDNSVACPHCGAKMRGGA